MLAQLQALVAGITTYPHHRPLYAGVVLIAVLVAQTTAICAVVLVRHRMPPIWLAVLDVAGLAGELVVGGLISAPGYGDTWACFVYPYSLIAIIGAGLALRRLPAVLALSAAPAVAYGLVNVSMMGEAPWNAVLDSLPYLLHSGVAWGVARALRRSNHRVDVAHRTLTDREVELAGAKERARHARILHDRVLQTLEILSQGDFVTDPSLRGHIPPPPLPLTSDPPLPCQS